MLNCLRIVSPSENAKTGESISEVPEVAITRHPKSRTLGVGSQARMHGAGADVQIVNPFSHPRSLVSDFTVGEQVFKEFVRRAKGNSLFSMAPIVIIHPMGNPLGGLTQIEIRAFHEMAIGAGASEVIVWQGHSLSDQEVLSKQFPADGQVLS